MKKLAVLALTLLLIGPSTALLGVAALGGTSATAAVCTLEDGHSSSTTPPSRTRRASAPSTAVPSVTTATVLRRAV